MLYDFYTLHKKLVLATIVVLLLLIVGLVVYRIYAFQVIGTSPSNGSAFSSQSQTIQITFNKTLNFIDPEQVTANKAIIIGTRTDKKVLFIQVHDLELHQTYHIQLRDILAEDGSELNAYTYSFTYIYKPFTSLTPGQQQSQINDTDKGNIDDPVIKALPVTTSNYYISYTLYSKPDQKGKYESITIALLLTPEQLAEPQVVASYKAQAVAYLASKGINVNNYVVQYSPPGI